MRPRAKMRARDVGAPLDAGQLIRGIWRQYRSSPPEATLVEHILAKAHASKKKEKPGHHYKIGTYISWWTRQLVKRKKSDVRKSNAKSS